MAELVTLVEQHMDRHPPTVAIQATTDGEGLEALFALANPQEDGLGVPLSVEVAMLSSY